ncbi:MAG: hypothetical protein C0434_06220 [Xanthomonadaceae bacterium]|nr:hypothetical protein [Xanthomonadaceae bacterium]
MNDREAHIRALFDGAPEGRDGLVRGMASPCPSRRAASGAREATHVDPIDARLGRYRDHPSRIAAAVAGVDILVRERGR